MRAVATTHEQVQHIEAWERALGAWFGGDEAADLPGFADGFLGALTNSLDQPGYTDTGAWQRLGQRVVRTEHLASVGGLGALHEVGMAYPLWGEQRMQPSPGLRAVAFMRGAVEAGGLMVRGEAFYLAPEVDAREAFPLGYAVLGGWLRAGREGWGRSGMGTAAQQHTGLILAVDDALARVRGEGIEHDHWHLSMANAALALLAGHPEDPALREIVTVRFGLGWPRLWGGDGIDWPKLPATRWQPRPQGGLGCYVTTPHGAVEAIGEMALLAEAHWPAGGAADARWWQLFAEGVAGLDVLRRSDFETWRRQVAANLASSGAVNHPAAAQRESVVLAYTAAVHALQLLQGDGNTKSGRRKRA